MDGIALAGAALATATPLQVTKVSTVLPVSGSGFHFKSADVQESFT